MATPLGNAARPGRHERIPRDARGLARVLELEDLQDLACSILTGVCNRRKAARQFDRRSVGRRRIRDDVIGVRGGVVDVDGRREVREAVVPGADDVHTRGVRMLELDPVTAARIAADGVDGSTAVTSDAMQYDPCIPEGRRFAAAAQDAPTDAYMRGLRGNCREGAEPPEQQVATA